MTTARQMNTHETPQADALRVVMVGELRELGAIRSDWVADAVRTVPRHLFAPEESGESAYAADSAVVTTRDEHGVAISSFSATHIRYPPVVPGLLR